MADKLMYGVIDTELMEYSIPESTRTYKTVSHKELIELTRESIDKAGFSIDKETYTSARGGKQANGRYTLKGGDSEMQIMLGWQNSYDKSISLKFAVGTSIFICSNGCISGNMGAFKKKHVGDVQEFTPTHVKEYLGVAEEIFTNMQKDRDRMKEIEVSKRIQAELLGRMFVEDAIITSTQLEIIKREIQAPTHDYKAPNSMWELYNFATYSFKNQHPSLYYKSHTDLHEFFKNESL